MLEIVMMVVQLIMTIFIAFACGGKKKAPSSDNAPSGQAPVSTQPAAKPNEPAKAGNDTGDGNYEDLNINAAEPPPPPPKKVRGKKANLKIFNKESGDSQAVTTVMRDENDHQQSYRQMIEQILVDYYLDLYSLMIPVTRTPTRTQELAPAIHCVEVLHAGISGDFLKVAGDAVIQKLNNRFNGYLIEQLIPEQCKISKTVLVFKKKNERDNNRNYRQISLLSQPYKLFTKIILNRLERTLNEYQPVEQARLRRGFCYMDPIQAITQLIGTTRKYKHLLILCFIDYAKAFDSIELKALGNFLFQAVFKPVCINMLEECNLTTSTNINMFHTAVQVPIGIEIVLVDGNKLSNIRFAD